MSTKFKLSRTFGLSVSLSFTGLWGKNCFCKTSQESLFTDNAVIFIHLPKRGAFKTDFQNRTYSMQME